MAVNKKHFFSVLLLLCVQIVETKIPLCISLGGACAPALNLRNLNLRTEAYPFDWLVSPFAVICAVLADDFEHFLENPRARADNQGILDYYGLTFLHDWPTDRDQHYDALQGDFTLQRPILPGWERLVPAVKEKYRRRIERFRAVCSGAEKVFFIREDIMTREQAALLRNILSKKYPTLDFVLLVFGKDAPCQTPWNIEGIQNFYVPKWNDAKLWAATLRQVGPEFAFLRGLNIQEINDDGHAACCAFECEDGLR